MAFGRGPSKFIRGEPFDDVHALISHVLNGGAIYAHGRVRPAAFACNWSLATLRAVARYGGCPALINPEWTALHSQGRALECVF